MRWASGAMGKVGRRGRGVAGALGASAGDKLHTLRALVLGAAETSAFKAPSAGMATLGPSVERRGHCGCGENIATFTRCGAHLAVSCWGGLLRWRIEARWFIR